LHPQLATLLFLGAATAPSCEDHAHTEPVPLVYHDEVILSGASADLLVVPPYAVELCDEDYDRCVLVTSGLSTQLGVLSLTAPATGYYRVSWWAED
jgi:hypothetical protein